MYYTTFTSSNNNNTNLIKTAMEIYNTTTGTIVNLTIINRPTNTEWTQDLIGNHGDLNYNSSAERYEMTQDQIDWWSNTIQGLNKIEDMRDQAAELLSTDDFEELERKLSDEGNGDDYEYHIRTLTTILDDVLVSKRIENIENSIDFTREQYKEKNKESELADFDTFIKNIITVVDGFDGTDDDAVFMANDAFLKL